MDFFTLLSKITSGAVVGYATNDLAVKMLFKEYLGLGGIVLKTHSEFVDNIAQLVERDIINHHTIEQELRNDRFAQALTKTVEDFFQKGLSNAIPTDFLLKDTPKIEHSFDNIRVDFIKHLATPAENIIGFLLEKIKFKQLFSEKQLQLVSNNLAGVLTEELGKNQISDFIELLFAEMQAKNLNEFVPDSIFEKIAGKFSRATHNLHQHIIYNQKNALDTLLNDILDEINTKQITQNLAQNFTEKTFAHLIAPTQWHALVDALKQELIAFLGTDEGKNLVKSLSQAVTSVLENEKTTIFELLSKDLNTNLEGFLQEKLPAILEKVIEFVRQQKSRIDFLIDETFRDKIKYKLQEWLVDIFVGSVSEEAGIVQRVVEYLEKYNSNELATKFTEEIINYLKTNTIGQIVVQIGKDKITDNLTTLLGDNLQNWLEKMPLDSLDALLNTKIGNVVSPQRIEDFLNLQIDNAIENLKNEQIYSEKTDIKLAQEVSNSVLKLQNLPLNQLIPPAKIAQYADTIEAGILRILKDQKDNLNTFIALGLAQELDNKSLSALVSNEKALQFLPMLLEKIDKFVAEQFVNFKETPLHQFLEKLNTAENFYPRLSEYLKNATLDNLPLLIEGKIEDIVRQNLKPLPPEKIRDMVESFMGKELAPINMLGAILGGITGGALAVLPTFQNPAITWSVNGLAYGITGYGTNWLALKMIFRPYKATKIGNLTVPFTPGIITKNKARFAENMGRFIDKSLLNKDTLIGGFQAQRTQIQSALVNFLSKDDYEILNRLNIANKDKTATFTAENAYQYFEANLGFFEQEVTNMIENSKDFTLAQFDTSYLKYRINHYFTQVAFQERVLEKVKNFLDTKIAENMPLKALLPISIVKNLYKLVENKLKNQLENAFDWVVSEEKFPQTIQQIATNFSGKYEEIKEKKIPQLLKNQQIIGIKTLFSDFLLKKLTEEKTQNIIFEAVFGKISKEISPERQIKDLVGGQLINFGRKSVKDVLENLVEKGIKWLETNKETLADDVYERAYDANIASYMYKGTIKETVFELATSGIPYFFKKRLPELEKIVLAEINELGETKLSRLNVRVEQDDLRGRLKNLSQNADLQDFIKKAAPNILEHSILDKKTSKFLEILELNDIKAVFGRLDEEIKFVQTSLKEKLTEKNKTEITAKLSQFLFANAWHFFSKMPLQTFLNGISNTEINDLAEGIVVPLLNSRAFQEQKTSLVEAFFVRVKNKPLSENMDILTLKQNILQTFQDLVKEKEVKDFLMEQIRQTTHNTLDLLNSNLDNETKDFALKLTAEAAFQSLADNIGAILATIDLQKIVVDEINAMHPKEVEKLFESFAGKYFSQLINYGFGFGVLFGLAIDLVLGEIGKRI